MIKYIMEGKSQQSQTFGNIAIGNHSNFTVNQIIQVTATAIQARSLNKTSPYRGLQKFEGEHKNLFFGRDQFLGELLAVIPKSNFLLVLGASGSGKSSLVRAGLIPQLREQLGSNFIDFTFTPDQNPFKSLWAILVSKGYKQSDAAIALQEETDTLERVIKTLKPPEQQWFVFIDQFEEIFTTTDIDTQKKFMASITALAKSEEQSVKIVLAMRSDFFGRFSPYGKLAEVAEKHLHLVKDMHPDELRHAIEQPAAYHGVNFEDGLVDEIIRDFANQPSLPLLQYTLNLLWENDDIEDRVLNIKTYRHIGGVRGALQRHVDDIYQKMTTEEKEATKQIFFHLVKVVGAGETAAAQAVRRRAAMSEFSSDMVTKTLQKLIDKNLLVSDASGTEAATVEVVHETLLSSWKTLENWLAERQSEIWLKNRLEEDARNWEKYRETKPERATEELWSGSKLDKVAEMRSQGIFAELFGGLSEAENQFIDASLRERDRLRHQELRQARRLALGASVAVVVISIFAAVTGYQLRQTTLGQIQNLNISARAFLLSNQGLEALTASVKAVKQLQKPMLWPPQELRQEVTGTLQTVFYGVRERNRLQGHSSPVTSVSFSPNGQTIATASRDNTVRLWNLQGKELAKIQYSGSVSNVSFSPDGQTIATDSQDNTVRLWNLQGEELAKLQHSSSVSSVSFSPDGKTIATASQDNTVRLWNLQGEEVAKLQHSGSVSSVSFSPDGQTIATASDDNTARLWNVHIQEVRKLKGDFGDGNRGSFSPDGKTFITINCEEKTACLWNLQGEELAKLKHSGSVISVSFSPDGQTVATATFNDTAHLWNLQGKELAKLPHSGYLTLHRGNWITRVSFSPDSKTVATASEDNTVRLWNLQGKELTKLQGHSEPVTQISFSPDGQTVATGSLDNTAHLWNLQGKELAKLQHSDLVDSVSFSPDGKTIATTASYDKTAHLWNLQGKELAKLQGHSEPVTKISFSPDGKTVATGSGDNTVRLWNLQGKELAKIQHSSWVNSVSFSPDGQTLATASGDNTTLLWELGLDSLLTRACAGLKDYLQFNPNVADEDRRLCD
ncbi:MAG TPA: hypothetical protein IGS52_23330 [Oscillatoriaceae cyanobacterium M33_DOE_052]|nr:hypothetical protein [Oscillatoriaceae cyanobacterium M33_DOE_052]